VLWGPCDFSMRPLKEAGLETRAWPALIDAMRSCAEQLEDLPPLLRECGVDPLVIDQRAGEIERLKDELRAIRSP